MTAYTRSRPGRLPDLALCAPPVGNTTEMPVSAFLRTPKLLVAAVLDTPIGHIPFQHAFVHLSPCFHGQRPTPQASAPQYLVPRFQLEMWHKTGRMDVPYVPSVTPRTHSSGTTHSA